MCCTPTRATSLLTQLLRDRRLKAARRFGAGESSDHSRMFALSLSVPCRVVMDACSGVLALSTPPSWINSGARLAVRRYRLPAHLHCH